MNNVRAKFVVNAVINRVEGSAVEMSPVTSGSPENDQFFRYTPWGKLEMNILNPMAAATFVPGKEYYLDFTPVE